MRHRQFKILIFLNKNSSILVLKVRKLDDEVIYIGREFQILGPW